MGEMSPTVDMTCKSLRNCNTSSCEARKLYCIFAFKHNHFQRMLKQLINNPKQIFLIDSIGALLTASILFSMAIGYPGFLGMPTHILFLLAAVAITFAVYSFCCFLFHPVRWRPYLKAIMLANAMYCILTAVLVYTLRNNITHWGLLYFMGEILVILVLLFFEYKVLAKNRC